MLDPIDRLSAGMFVVTMLAERRALRRRGATVPDDQLAAHAPLTGSADRLPADPLGPVGYEARDTATSLAMLLGNVAVTQAMAAPIGALNRRANRRAIARLGTGPAAFPAAMVLWDFLYYWEHRWMHEVRVFWANHVTHHSSERYNLSTALRQPWSPFLLAWVFLPMPVLGFRNSTILRAGQLNLLYQYWIHTEAIDRLPARAEAILNTPSHHRVHHGANRQYLDKNYGGILILWDKLFGTFEPEVRRVRYGLTKNIGTFNPLRVGYHEFADIVADVRRAPTRRQRLHHIFGRPGWTPTATTTTRPDDHATQIKEPTR